MFISFLIDGLLILLFSSLVFRSLARTIGVFKEVFRHEKKDRVPRN